MVTAVLSKYVLIIMVLGYNGMAGNEVESIPFNTLKSCQMVAKQVIAEVDKHGVTRHNSAKCYVRD